MLWPTGCVDNFFEEPNKILEFSNTLNYKKDIYVNGLEKEQKILLILIKSFLFGLQKKL